MALGNLNQQIGEFDAALENYKIINKLNPQTPLLIKLLAQFTNMKMLMTSFFINEK